MCRQQSFAFLAFDWNWSRFLIDLKQWFGSFVLVDFPTLTGGQCLMGDSFMGGYEAAFPPIVLVVLACVACISYCLGSRGEHLSNFGWAVFTLLSPAVVATLSTADPRGLGGWWQFQAFTVFGLMVRALRKIDLFE